MSLIEKYPEFYLYRRVVASKLYIDSHFAEKIDLSNIADEACFSKFHFIRLFHSVYKKTPYQYLLSVRIEKAKRLLVTDLTISQVCYTVGFESVSSFAGLFKRSVCQTPANYQLKEKTKLMEMQKSPLKFVPNCFAEKNGWRQESQF